MTTYTLRGHEIEFVNGKWRYIDTKEPTATNWNKRPCGYCGLHNTIEGHDACLGTLPGVMNACCGHGDDECAYVQFLDCHSVHGKDGRVILEVLKKYSLEVSK